MLLVYLVMQRHGGIESAIIIVCSRVVDIMSAIGRNAQAPVFEELRRYLLTKTQLGYHILTVHIDQ